MNQASFKDKNRKNVCTTCPKRLACYELNSVCELVTPCDACEIRNTCTSLCEQMNAYLQRGSKPEFKISQVPEEDLPFLLPVVDDSPKKPTKTILWEILDERDRYLLTEHFINGRSQEDIANELGVTKQRVSSIIYGNQTKNGLLHKLRVFHRVRELLLKHIDSLPEKYKTVLVERYIKLKKPAELVRVDRPLPMVYRWLQRGRKMLQKLEKESRGQNSTNSKVYRITTKNKNGSTES